MISVAAPGGATARPALMRTKRRIVIDSIRPY